MRRLAVALRASCPRCGDSLKGDPTDAFLVCRSCREARESLLGGRVLAMRYTEAPPAATAGPAVPFFRFSGVRPRVRALGAGAEAAARAADRVEVVWVLAARVRGFHSFGDAGLEYTRRPPRLAAGPPIPSVGVARRFEDAVAVMRALLWRLTAEHGPTAGYTLEPEAEEAEIWVVPTIVDGAHLKFPHGTIRYPAEAVER